MLALLSGFAVSAFAQRTVTLQLNTASLPDTLDALDEVQVRGCLAGCEGDQSELPGDQIIAWNDATTLTATNDGGDYWSLAFQIPEDDTLNFKFYSQLAEDSGVGGWEDGSDHVISPGTGDTTLTLHFYRKGSGAEYDWRPHEEKPDTVAVWFRVYMNSTDAEGLGYDRENESQVIGIRGDSTVSAGGLNWGITRPIAVEDTSENRPAYHLWSGVVYYPAEKIGMTQPYKFIIGDGGWEDREGGDRTFTIPDQDTTLHWVFFGDSRAVGGAERVDSQLIFTVDLDAFEEIGLFRKARADTIQVRGTINEWLCNPPGDDCRLQEVPATNQFELAVPVSLFPNDEVQYKFFLQFNVSEFETEFGSPPPSGWEEGHNTGVNREQIFEGTPTQDFGIQYFNDVRAENVIPDGTSIDVHFSVNMDTTEANRPFDPENGDSLIVEINDPIWGFLHGADTFLDGNDRPDLIGFLTDDDEDNVYEGTITVNGPTYSLLTFKYGYGQRVGGVYEGYIEEGGQLGATPGRNRAHYVEKNPDGSWPSEWTLPAHDFTPTGPLPYTGNPVGVEQIDSELPEKVTLLGNYPNPFSESTTFDYTVTEKTKVTISVFNVLGQRVATVVDGVQAAGTYRATFEPRGLSSGTYFYRLEAEGQVVARPMIIVK